MKWDFSHKKRRSIATSAQRHLILFSLIVIRSPLRNRARFRFRFRRKTNRRTAQRSCPKGFPEMVDTMFIGSMHGVADSCSLNGGFRLDVANTRLSEFSVPLLPITQNSLCHLMAQPRRKFEKNEGRLPPAILPHSAHGPDGARGLENRLPAQQQGLHGRVRRLARTVARDLDLLREEERTSLEYDEARYGFRLTDRPSACPVGISRPGGLHLRPRAQAAGPLRSDRCTWTCARSWTRSPSRWRATSASSRTG